MRKIEVEIKGERYLMNKFVPSIDTESKKKKRVYVPKEEAEKKTYRRKDGKLYIPSTQIEATMIKAGTDFRMDKNKTYKEYIKGGIYVEPFEILITPQKYEIFESQGVINRARVLIWRPEFKNWSAKFIINVTDEILDVLQLKEILIEAGKHKGIGDWRPKFGRFEIVHWKVIAN
jgi:hypothetical protein